MDLSAGQQAREKLKAQTTRYDRRKKKGDTKRNRDKVNNNDSMDKKLAVTPSKGPKAL